MLNITIININYPEFKGKEKGARKQSNVGTAPPLAGLSLRH